jgi:hypothetical protein
MARQQTLDLLIEVRILAGQHSSAKGEMRNANCIAGSERIRVFTHF